MIYLFSDLLNMHDLMKELLYFCTSESLQKLSLVSKKFKDIIRTKKFINSYISFKNECILDSKREFISDSHFFHLIEIMEFRKIYFNNNHITIYKFNKPYLTKTNISCDEICDEIRLYSFTNHLNLPSFPTKRHNYNCKHCTMCHENIYFECSELLNTLILNKFSKKRSLVPNYFYPICSVLFFFEFIYLPKKKNQWTN